MKRSIVRRGRSGGTIRRWTVALVVLLMLQGIAFSGRAQAGSDGVVDLVDDCIYQAAASPACQSGEPVVGTVAFQQDAGGLHLTIEIVSAQPGEYTVMLTGCGPGGVTSCGGIAAGTVVLGPQGTGGPVSVTVPTQSLLDAAFAATGLNSVKVSLVKPGPVRAHARPGALVATGIQFLLP